MNFSGLKFELGRTQWVVWTDFGNIGFGSGCDPTPYFDEALDGWSDQMGEGCPSAILQIDAALGTVADVTAAAASHLMRRLVNRGDEIPQWLTDMEF